MPHLVVRGHIYDLLILQQAFGVVWVVKGGNDVSRSAWVMPTSDGIGRWWITQKYHNDMTKRGIW